MVFSILFLILIILFVAVCLFFLFVYFLPSLRAQKINAQDPMFSHEEVMALKDENTFKRDNAFLHSDIGQERLLSLFLDSAGNIVDSEDFYAAKEDVGAQKSSPKKPVGYTFWKKLYSTLHVEE